MNETSTTDTGESKNSTMLSEIRLMMFRFTDFTIFNREGEIMIQELAYQRNHIGYSYVWMDEIGMNRCAYQSCVW
jgi:hypothetical protein